MLSRNVAYYEARVVFGMTSLIPALLLPGYALLGLLIWANRPTRPAVSELQTAFMLMLPLGAALAAAHLMTIEREEEFDGLRRSYPEPAWKIPLMRACGATVFMLLSGISAALIFRLTFGDYDAGQFVLPAFVPAFYLMALALFANNLIGNYWLSVAGVVAYWYLEFNTQGKYTGALFLFNSLSPLPDVDPNLNRALLFAVGLFWITLNIGYSMWRRRQAVG